MTCDRRSFPGVRVLLVEDNFAVARELNAMLLEMGATVQGPFGCLETATAGRDGCDVALLDVNLRGEPVFPLAERLIQGGVPIALVTGYDRSMLPVQFRDLPILGKPVEFDALGATLESMVWRATEAGV